MNQYNPFRVLSIALTTRGFGYAVIEGEHRLIAYGRKKVAGEKNIRTLAAVKKMIAKYLPNLLVLYDVNAKGIHRSPRIKRLHSHVVTMAKQHKLKTTEISRIEVQRLLLGDAGGTKHEVAELLARQFPDELASRLPPRRKWYDPEDGRIDIFDAVALVMASRLKETKRTV